MLQDFPKYLPNKGISENKIWHDVFILINSTHGLLTRDIEIKNKLTVTRREEKRDNGGK